MRFVVGGTEAYAYTGARSFEAGRPTLVLVHGAGNDHSVWALQSRYLAHHGRNVLAVDLPGHGRSAGPACASVEAVAEWLGAALAALGVARYAVAGHSMGALAALEHAARHPGRVEALVLLGVAAPMAVSDALLDAAAHDEPLAAALITGWSYTPAGQLGGGPVPGIWLAGQARAMLARMPRGVLLDDLRACNAYSNALAAAAAVLCPVLCVLGARDVMAPARNSAALTAALADARGAAHTHARTVVLPDTGHAMMAERPDGVLDALRAFLP